MTNAYYSPTTIPAHSQGRSSAPNNQFLAIEDGFDKLPTEAELKQGTAIIATDSGVADAYILTATNPPSAYAANLALRFKAGSTNTGASTVNVYDAASALIGVASIRNYAGSALTGGEIVANAFTDIVYDGSAGYFRIVNPVTAVASVSTNNKLANSADDANPDYIENKIQFQGPGAMRTDTGGGDEKRVIEVYSINTASYFMATA